MPVVIVEADLSRPDHQHHVLMLTDAYARDPMGSGQPLAPEAAEQLIEGLRFMPTTLILLAYADGEPAGLATCFLGFSTFAARPLVNIHDLAVRPEYRGLGLGRELLAAVEARARELGCCKVTLEVMEHNHRAKAVYAAAGFGHAYADGPGGGALFYDKRL
ncbi:MAG: GNAT family N-acetyltransferase [Armatimonadetes bacterium]|nr:GNAT family N-acetyltransferase [Armatimonadota bacterium]